jgi:hypothetical protein
MILGSFDKTYQPVPVVLEVEPKQLPFYVQIHRHLCIHLQRKLAHFCWCGECLERRVVEKNWVYVLCQIHFD